MRLSLAANYDLELIPQLRPYPVEEVYGKLPADLVGGGRPSYMGRGLNWKQLAAYVGALRDAGIAFNYLLNSACLGNREWSRRWQRGLARLIGRLREIGVTRVTVSTPYLLERVRALWPQVHVRVGIFAQVDTACRARFWEALGADAITLESFSINRDFPRLASIRKAVQCDLHLIANHICLPNCPLQPYHQAGFAHASDGSGKLFVDYCMLRCARRRLEDPALFIKSGWIRPEDTAAYEQTGYDCFKLLERNAPSPVLLERVKAYSARQSPDNLADLLLPYGFKDAEPKRLSWFARHFFRPWAARTAKLMALARVAKRQGFLAPRSAGRVRLRSAALPDDFLDGFRRRDCSRLDCNTCGYCQAIAAEALDYDEAVRRSDLEEMREAEAMLTDGSLW